jgi:hypothetical protein
VGELRRIREAAAQAAAESRQQSATQQQGNTLLGGGIAELAFRYNTVVGALQNLRATAQPVYDALIASNEKLNAQILSSQTNLASSTRLFKSGVEVTDPTAKIQASAGALRAAIKQIEIDTQSLVGVTSAQVNELFQITLTNAGALNNQSKQFPDAIAAATSLTKGWAASLKVVGIPLNQARQEINSIIKGQITQDSLLAKNLNITNQQVEAWRSQGKLVDELNKRLDVFVAGNAIAARSIEGISSNILDLSERIARNVGEPLLEPLIDSLAEVEKYLKASEDAIIGFFRQLSDEILRQGGTIAEAFKPLGKTLLEIGADLGPIALSAIKGILNVLSGLAQVIAPLANQLASVVKLLADFAATDLGGVVVQTAAVVLVLGQLSAIISGLAVAAVPALATAVLSLASKMLLLEGSIGAAGLISVVSSVSMGALSGVLKLLAADAIALNLALIPLTAAIGLAVLVRTTNDLKDANEALEEYGKQILTTADGVFSISSELNRYNKIVEDGGVLTDKQISRQKQLRVSASAQVEGIQLQIKAQKELTKLSDDQAQQRDSNIKQLEALAERLEKAAGGLKLQAKELEDLGTTSELFAKKLENAKRNFNSPADAEQFKEGAKQILSLVKSGVDAKLLSVEAGRKEIEAVKTNTKVELETRFAAKEAINKLYDSRISKVKELIEVDALQAATGLDGLSKKVKGSVEVDIFQSSTGLDELAKIRDDATLEASTRQKAAQQIVGIRKEQIDAESVVIAAGQARIAALQSQRRIGEARADEEATKLKVAEINKRIQIAKVEFENATNSDKRAKFKAEAEKSVIEFDKLEADLLVRRRKRAIEDFDERRNLIKAQNDLGLIDRGTYNQQILANDLAQNDAAINQQRKALGLLSVTDKEGREAINSQIAQLQSKRVEIAGAFDQADLKRQTEFFDQELTALETAKNERVITESEYAQQRTQNRIQQADAEIAVARRELTRLGANDIEGRNAINARINELGSKRLKTLEEFYGAELALVKDAQAKVLDLINQSEQQRLIDLRKLVNQRLIRQEDADKARNRSTVAKQRAELQQAQDFESALARISGAVRSPEAERVYQQQVRDARSKTLSVTLQLAQAEGNELERLRGLALKGIEDEVSARARSVDLQLSQIAQVSGERERASKDAEASAGREVFALDLVTKTLERQNSLLIARNNLTKARFDAAISEGDLELARVNRAIELKRQLDSNLPTEQRIILMRELADLTQNSGASEYQLVQQKLAIEQQNAAVKRESVLFQQAGDRAALSVEQQKIDLANQRAVIEARIAELKAKQAVLDAKSVVDQTELKSRKSIDAANLALEQAKALQPGRERDKAIADAKNRLAIATTEAETSTANALQGVDLAKQQAEFASQTTLQAVEQVKSFSSVKDLQAETLKTQQNMVLEQLKAAEAAKKYADELERAKAALTQTSTTYSTPLVFQARARGGSVSSGQAYIVGENSPELFVPGVSGTVLNREQILKNLGGLGELSLNVGGGKGVDNQQVVAAVQSLEQTIRSRPPAPIVANFAAADDGQLDKMFAIQRSALRIT